MQRYSPFERIPPKLQNDPALGETRARDIVTVPFGLLCSYFMTPYFSIIALWYFVPVAMGGEEDGGKIFMLLLPCHRLFPYDFA
jgi:hypothetical protein